MVKWVADFIIYTSILPFSMFRNKLRVRRRFSLESGDLTGVTRRAPRKGRRWRGRGSEVHELAAVTGGRRLWAVTRLPHLDPS